MEMRSGMIPLSITQMCTTAKMKMERAHIPNPGYPLPVLQ